MPAIRRKISAVVKTRIRGLPEGASDGSDRLHHRAQIADIASDVASLDPDLGKCLLNTARPPCRSWHQVRPVTARLPVRGATLPVIAVNKSDVTRYSLTLAEHSKYCLIVASWHDGRPARLRRSRRATGSRPIACAILTQPTSRPPLTSPKRISEVRRNYHCPFLATQ